MCMCMCVCVCVFDMCIFYFILDWVVCVCVYMCMCAGMALDYPQGIEECGSDALRYGLLAYTNQGLNINLNVELVVAKRKCVFFSSSFFSFLKKQTLFLWLHGISPLS
jgi:hypothetical protein